MTTHTITNVKRCNNPKKSLFNCMIHNLENNENKNENKNEKTSIRKNELIDLNIETKCYQHFRLLVTCLNRDPKITWSGPS
jgi:hypothetical protein